MTEFDDLLNELARVSGVRGAAVATTDGIVAASRLQGRYRDDVVVGLTSFLISTTHRAIGIESAKVLRFHLHSTHGKLLVEDLGSAYLVVITDQFARLEAVRVEIEDIARRMRRATRVDV